MNKKRTNKLYNFIVNNYGLSKDVIMEHVNSRLDSLMDKHIENLIKSKINSEAFDRHLVFMLSAFIKNEKEISIHSWNRGQKFIEVLKQCTKESVIEELNANFKLNVSLTQKKEE